MRKGSQRAQKLIVNQRRIQMLGINAAKRPSIITRFLRNKTQLSFPDLEKQQTNCVKETFSRRHRSRERPGAAPVAPAANASNANRHAHEGKFHLLFLQRLLPRVVTPRTLIQNRNEKDFAMQTLQPQTKSHTDKQNTKTLP